VHATVGIGRGLLRRQALGAHLDVVELEAVDAVSVEVDDDGVAVVDERNRSARRLRAVMGPGGQDAVEKSGPS
jgi:hypothetical protein